MSLTSAQAYEITKNLTKDELILLQESMKVQCRRLDRIASTKFSAGDRVKWEHRDHNGIMLMYGTVRKANIVTCSVETGHGIWTVDSGMLSLVPSESA